MLKNRILAGSVLIITLILTGCIEDYWPEIDKYDNLLVVDGGINNLPGPYTVKLSLSSPADSAVFTPFPNCEVTLIDDEGYSEILQEMEPGIYRSRENGIQGIAGRSYKMQILTPEDVIYTTDFEKLKPASKIASVYARVEKQQDEGYPHDLEGYRFYLDTETAESDTNYYLWRLEATYQYQSDFTIRWIFDGELNWFYHPDSLFNCWSTYVVDAFYTMSTESMEVPVITEYPLHFVNTETRQLSVRYSLLVRQYTLNKAAFQFWDALREQNDSQGSLYANQPYQVRGNVRNLSDGSEPVLGYFLVAGLDTSRIFIDRPPSSVNFYYPVCTLDEADYEAYGQMWWADPVTYPIYAIETNGGRRAVPPKGCVDCRLKGGTIIKPGFWTD
ncbi:MAG: DUF4249 domain-containing protein [bacterium]